MITNSALQLILAAEGLGQPSHWPGGDSGITIGHGYDLGFVDRGQLASDWSKHLSPEALDRLGVACLRRGFDARVLAPHYRDITITAAAAREVFLRISLPHYEALARETFGPGFSRLPPDAQGALVSLVYNRGGSLVGEQRAEMRTIRHALDALQGGDVPGVLAQVAAELRAMKRLWVGKGLDGLLARREAEARLVESA